MKASHGVRRPFRILAWTLLVLGSSLFFYSVRSVPAEVTPNLLLLLVATVIAENFALSMPGYGVSLTYPLLIALAIVCGPSAAMFGALLCAVNVGEMKMRLPVSVYAFNTGQLLLSNGLAAWAYLSWGGRVLTSSGGILLGEFPGILVPLFSMAAIGALGNFALIALGYALKEDLPAREVISAVGWLPPVQVALAGVGVLLAQVMTANMAALPLFILPLFVARQFYQRFMGLQDAYVETIRSLVTALEAKDPYTRGHSERVAEWSVKLAREIGADDRAVADIEKAALLHDLGKLTVGGEILRKVTPLTNEEWGKIQTHPVVGAGMVARIPHLRRLSDAVLMHHERLDGSGYPNGVTSAEIGIEARVLAIADSYDAMTTDRPYRKGMSREAAIAELDKCAGALYDRAMVGAFRRVVGLPGETIVAVEGRLSAVPGGDAA